MVSREKERELLRILYLLNLGSISGSQFDFHILAQFPDLSSVLGSWFSFWIVAWLFRFVLTLGLEKFGEIRKGENKKWRERTGFLTGLLNKTTKEVHYFE